MPSSWFCKFASQKCIVVTSCLYVCVCLSVCLPTGFESKAIKLGYRNLADIMCVTRSLISCWSIKLSLQCRFVRVVKPVKLSMHYPTYPTFSGRKRFSVDVKQKPVLCQLHWHAFLLVHNWCIVSVDDLIRFFSGKADATEEHFFPCIDHSANCPK